MIAHSFAVIRKETSVPILVQYLQLFMEEMLTSTKNLDPTLLRDIFPMAHQNYGLGNQNRPKLAKIQTSTYGIKAISFIDNNDWQGRTVLIFRVCQYLLTVYYGTVYIVVKSNNDIDEPG